MDHTESEERVDSEKEMVVVVPDMEAVVEEDEAESETVRNRQNQKIAKCFLRSNNL